MLMARNREVNSTSNDITHDRVPRRRQATAETTRKQVDAEQRTSRLVLPRNRLVGRDGEVAAIQQILLQEQVGLLTLTGPGGIGKTRLAMQVAANLLDHFVDGVHFVPLAPIRDPGQVAAAIAQVLDVREVPGRTLPESLQQHLRDQQALLVLDNFEQAMAAATLVSALLAACRCLKILVTSRAPLHLYGEHEYSVPPLALPDPKQLASVAADPDAVQAAFAAVQLFCQRAKAVKPDFALTTGNAVDVARICIDLDGLPLAIELAAARIKLLSPSALLARLNQRLALLTGGPQDAPARQRTLRDEIAWSYNLLAPGEQAIFRCLAVFVGGFTLAAAHAVANARADLGVDFLDGITTLLDQSLVKSLDRPDGAARLGMLETIREYGQEQLEIAGELADTRRAFVQYYLALAEAGAPALHGAGQAAVLAQLTLEYANLQMALAWSHTTQGMGQVALRLASALFDYWLTTGRWHEGRTWLEGALAETTADQRTELRAGTLSRAGALAYLQGDYEVAQRQTEEAVDIARELPAPKVLALSLLGLGWLALEHQNRVLAITYLEEALALARALGDRYEISSELVHLGSAMCEQGDYAKAQLLYEEGLALFVELGLDFDIADGHYYLGQAARLQGDYTRAWALFRESLARWRALGLTQWGWIAECLDAMAMICIAQKHLVEAGRLAGAAEALRNLIGTPAASRSRSAFVADFSTVRSQEDRSRFDQGWAKGNELSSEEAMDYALSLPAELGAARLPARTPAGAALTPYPANLTGREVEILRLLAQGLTYAQIADQLIITRRTVNGHVTSIYSKLGVNGRAAAARSAQEYRLL
jgi:predicted ATPase/DNA-binding CsgD family transcriptional regulator